MKKLLSMSLFCLMLVSLPVSALAAELTCWFPPDWTARADQARNIARTLSDESGVDVRPRIAKSYPEILQAFSTSGQNLVYVGSFAQALIYARNLGIPLAQSVNGKELYSGVFVYPKGENPVAILRDHPAEIAFAIGASSGESSAKAATGGKAAIGVPHHGAACGAVKAGKAKGAVVKNWWWESNSSKFPELAMYEIPDISIAKNPDNVLTASKAVPVEIQDKIKAAALKNPGVFGGDKMAEFDEKTLLFSLKLMKQGNIDPLSYAW